MLRVDAKSTGISINRYITYHTFVKLDDDDPENKKIAYERKGYHIEWKNVKNDLKCFLKNPRYFAPKLIYRVAYSLAVFWFIIQGRHQEAIAFAFAGPIAVDATTATATTGAQTSISISHTTSGADRVIVSGIEIVNSTSTWTYAGTAIVEDTTDASDMNHKMGHLIAPTSGANTLEHVKIAGAEAGHGIFGISFTGADQTTQPDSTSPTPTTATNTTPSIAITTTTDNAYVVDNLLSRAATLTVDASQTQIANQTIDSGTSRRQGGSYEQKVTAGSITMSWSLSASVLWVMLCVAVRPAAAAGGGNPNLLMLGVQ